MKMPTYTLDNVHELQQIEYDKRVIIISTIVNQLIEYAQLDNSNAMKFLGDYYCEQKDYESMIKYYLMAIERGNVDAMYNLGSYYENHKDYSNMLKYYLMAIEKGDSDAMYNLGIYYKAQKDYSNMMKYYLMAVEKGNSDAMYNLGIYYKAQIDYDNMMKYFLMAIERNNAHSMYNLGHYYEERKEYDNMKKYYLMAIENGFTNDSLKTVKSVNDLYNKLTNDLIFEQMKSDDVKLSLTCAICMTYASNVFLSCGHIIICDTCESHITTKECPKCKTQYNKFIKVFFN